MKLKKLLILGSMLPLITSCGKNSIAGTYAFQMGKEKGTHFGLFMNLSDDPYTEQDGLTGYKQMTFSFNVSFPEGDSEQTQDEMKSILDFFKDEDGNFSLNGYYKLGDERNKAGEQRLIIGFYFFYMLEKFEEVYESTEEELPESTKTALNILNNSDLIQSIMYATYTSDGVNAYIPVSLEDVYYQLYWYGYDIQIDAETTDIKLVEVYQHDFGTNPTKDDVAEINKTFEADHKGMMFTTYRAFNDLKLTLLKK